MDIEEILTDSTHLQEEFSMLNDIRGNGINSDVTILTVTENGENYQTFAHSRVLKATIPYFGSCFHFNPDKQVCFLAFIYVVQ